jgi:hypothetical protein
VCKFLLTLQTVFLKALKGKQILCSVSQLLVLCTVQVIHMLIFLCYLEKWIHLNATVVSSCTLFSLRISIGICTIGANCLKSIAGTWPCLRSLSNLLTTTSCSFSVPRLLTECLHFVRACLLGVGVTIWSVFTCKHNVISVDNALAVLLALLISHEHQV